MTRLWSVVVQGASRPQLLAPGLSACTRRIECTRAHRMCTPFLHLLLAGVADRLSVAGGTSVAALHGLWPE